MNTKIKKILFALVLICTSMAIFYAVRSNEVDKDLLDTPSQQSEELPQEQVDVTTPDKTSVRKDAVDISEQQKDDNTMVEIESESANVVIVDAAQYGTIVEVRAFVSNIVSDGDCTITFSQDDIEITKTTPAYAEATTSPCLTLEVPVDEFPKLGEWDTTVYYESDLASGSAKKTINIE